jgi:hypothetical protein
MERGRIVSNACTGLHLLLVNSGAATHHNLWSGTSCPEHSLLQSRPHNPSWVVLRDSDHNLWICTFPQYVLWYPEHLNWIIGCGDWEASSRWLLGAGHFCQFQDVVPYKYSASSHLDSHPKIVHQTSLHSCPVMDRWMPWSHSCSEASSGDWSTSISIPHWRI